MKIKLYNTISFNNCKLKLTHDAKDTRFSLFRDGSKCIVQYYPEMEGIPIPDLKYKCIVIRKTYLTMI